MTLLVRKYQPEDQATVWELHEAGLRQMDAFLEDGVGVIDTDLVDISNSYFTNNGDFLIGLVDGQIVAMGGILPKTSTQAEIKRMRVRQKYQGRGFGQELLSRLIARAKELGYSSLFLDTSIYQLPAQKLYLKNGFKEVERSLYYGVEVIFFEREI